MKPRQISITSLILALLTGIWIICMVLLVQRHGTVIATFEEAYEFVKDPGALFYLTYWNVVVLTILDVVLFGMLYLYFKSEYPVLSLCGLLFVPVYAAYNGFVYVSQVSVVQQIISVYDGVVGDEIMNVFLGQFLQLWEHSTAAFLNNYAYAILGIPSFLFGIALFRIKPGSDRPGGAGHTAWSKITGISLMLSALACLLGMIGILTKNQVLASGSAVGGGLFFLSLTGMAIVFWKE
jgi:hypothetical protein